MSLVALVVSCAAAGCKDEDIFEACTRLCQERITCAEERKLTPPTQTGCETACISTRGNYFVELALEDCKDKTSCEFEKCVNPDYL